MGHYCRICGRHRPNEKFSGKGHRRHICKKCAQRPKAEIAYIEQREEMCGFLNQSHISKKNVERLTILASSEDARIATFAQRLLEVARFTPYKKRRYVKLRDQAPELFKFLGEEGLLPWDVFPDDDYDSEGSEEPEVFEGCDGVEDCDDFYGCAACEKNKRYDLFE